MSTCASPIKINPDTVDLLSASTGIPLQLILSDGSTYAHPGHRAVCRPPGRSADRDHPHRRPFPIQAISCVPDNTAACGRHARSARARCWFRSAPSANYRGPIRSRSSGPTTVSIRTVQLGPRVGHDVDHRQGIEGGRARDRRGHRPNPQRQPGHAGAPFTPDADPARIPAAAVRHVEFFINRPIVAMVIAILTV